MVMPLYDDNPFKLPHRPLVTWGLIAANIVFYAAEIGSGDPKLVVDEFGLTPVSLIGESVAPVVLSPVVTLLSYMFLHADVAHLLGNMIFIWVFGDNIEEALGRLRFLLFYLLCGAAGALVFAATDLHSQISLIGASGAISGIVAAYAMLRPCAKVTALAFGIPLRISAFWIIGIFVVIQFIHLSSASDSDVAYWCHVGGLAAGAILFPIMRPAGVKLFQCIDPAVAAPDTEPPVARAPELSGSGPGHTLR